MIVSSWSLAGSWLRRTVPSADRLDANPVIDGRSDPLLAAEVAFCRLDRDMPEKKLNLVQFPACRVAKPGTAAAKIMRRERGYAGSCRILSNDVPNSFLTDAGTPGPARFVDPAKHSSARYVRSAGPLIHHCLDPIRNGNGAGVTCLTVQVDDRPVLFPLLNVAYLQ